MTLSDTDPPDIPGQHAGPLTDRARELVENIATINRRLRMMKHWQADPEVIKRTEASADRYEWRLINEITESH